MDDEKINKEIQELLRDDYGFPVLQEFLAELILKTRDLNTGSTSKRFEDALKLFLGKIGKKNNNKEYERDDLDLAEVAMLCDLHKHDGSKKLTIGQAIAQVGRQRYIDEPPPKKLADKQLYDIDAHRNRLKRKIKKHGLDYFYKHYQENFYETEHIMDTTPEQAKDVKSLFSCWLQKYDGLWTFLEE